MTERPPDLDELLLELIELPGEARAARLAAIGEGHPGIRRELESLLAAREGARRFFDGFDRGTGVDPAARAPSGDDDWIGRTVGAWHLVRRIGTGGMGTVYLGERRDGGFEQRVAIKRIAPGQGAPGLETRFLRERRLLAGLDHPGIARLIDGGTSDDGHPWLAMEFVDGRTIDEWCRERHPSIEERLALFLQVCDAVHHAHRHLVIHRDLKPANILVDADGRARLLDFGIARMIDPGDETGGGATDATVTRWRAFTPRYASPEQCRGERMTTSTDIWSLGIVLYEMLAGRNPHGDAATPSWEVESAIRDKEPTRPSRVAGVEARVVRRLRGDLDTIVMKALQHDPDRRYGGVEELAGDIRRHLAGEAVLARPDTAGYRLSRFVRRNPLLVGGVALVLVVLSMALVVTGLALRAAAARTEELSRLSYASAVSGAAASLAAHAPIEARSQLERAPVERRGWEWRHLAARLDRGRLHWQAHPLAITRLDLGADGTVLASGSIDSTVALWNMADGRRLAHWGPLPGTPETVALMTDSRSVVVGLTEGNLYLLPADSTAAPVLLNQGGAFTQVASSPDHRRFVLGDFMGALEVWEGLPPTRRRSWPAHDHLTIAAFTADGKSLLSGGDDGHLRTWNTDDGALRSDIAAHDRRVYAVAVDPGGRYAATGSIDRTIQVWDRRDAHLVQTFREHRATITSMAFRPGTTQIVSAAADGRLLRWDAAQPGVSEELRGHEADISSVLITPDGRTLVTADWKGEIRLWDVDVEDVPSLALPRLPTRMPRATVLAMAQGAGPGDDFATGGSEPWLTLGRTGAPHDTVNLPCRAIAALAWLGPTTGFVVLTDQDLVGILDPIARSFRWSGTAGSAGRPHLAAHPASGLVAVAGESDSLVHLWQVSGRELKPLPAHPAPAAASLAWLSSEEALLIGGSDGSVTLDRPDTDTSHRLRPPDGSPVRDMAVTADDRFVFVATQAGHVEKWSLDTGHPAAPPLALGARAMSLALSPDGRRLAVGGSDQIVRIVDTATLDELAPLGGHVGGIARLAWTADGHMLVSASSDGTLRFWSDRSVPSSER